MSPLIAIPAIMPIILCLVVEDRPMIKRPMVAFRSGNKRCLRGEKGDSKKPFDACRSGREPHCERPWKKNLNREWTRMDANQVRITEASRCFRDMTSVSVPDIESFEMNRRALTAAIRVDSR